MSRARPGLFAHAVAVLIVAVGIASCTSVLALDDYEPASGALCKLLDSCYAGAGIPNCSGYVDDSLFGAADKTADDWLRSIATEGCFDNCTAARSCLDIPPVCAIAVGSTCAVKDECCTFTKGAVDCVRNRCCLTDGQRCEADSDCCGTTCSDGRCGGIVCRDAGSPCDIDARCCTKSCRRNECTKEICRPDGFDCADADACCSEFCGADGRCGQPACGAESAPCGPTSDCCDGLVCYALGTKSFCSPGMCTPLEIDCGNDSQCCTGFCDPVVRVCATGCRTLGDTCDVDGQCCTGTCTDGFCAGSCSKADCDADSDCCSGKCVAHTCAPECSTETCGHDVCAPGAPLNNACSGVQTPSCVDEVCKIDPYCCCNAWDSFCVGLVAGACKQPCP